MHLPFVCSPQTHFAVESVKDTFNTVAAMKSVATTLKVEHKKLDIGEIEDLQDDLAGTGASCARRRVARSPA